MTTLVIERETLPKSVSSLFRTPRVVIEQRDDCDFATMAPLVIDPADYDNDTDYLNAIPGMTEKLLEGFNTPLSECISHDELWDDDDV